MCCDRPICALLLTDDKNNKAIVLSRKLMRMEKLKCPLDLRCFWSSGDLNGKLVLIVDEVYAGMITDVLVRACEGEVIRLVE